jgi:hypothetical protein
MRRLESHESFTADTRVHQRFHNTIPMNFAKPCLHVPAPVSPDASRGGGNQKSIIFLKNHFEIAGVVAFSGQS